MPGRSSLSKRKQAEIRKRALLQKAREQAGKPVESKPRLVSSQDAPKTALQAIKDAGRLTAKQERGLRLYGALVRAVELSGADGLGSCLGALNRVDYGSGAAAESFDQTYETAAWIAQSKSRLADARAALGYDPADAELDAARAMVVACDLVAGKGVHPRTITKDQLEQAEIESGLRIAGDLLARHFEREKIN